METLPEPANGDIFAFGGGLSIGNAAANVFIIHDTRLGSTALLPSSLSVGFVLGNVYHIDASLFSRYCSTLVGGTLVKGLGLQAEGCHLGDRSIDTVYDDIICVVSGQGESGCSIGSVAGDVVSVTHPDDDMKDPELPHNLIIAHVAGQFIRESRRENEGSLARALLVWSSMKFPPCQPGGAQNPAIAKGTNLSVDKNIVTPFQPFSRPVQADPKENVESQLLKALSELDEARQELASWKRQSLGFHHELTQAETNYTENLALTELQHKHLPAPVQSAMVCGNCGRRGHEVRECIGPVDDQGYISACPLCNTRAHRFDNCRNVPSRRIGKRNRQWVRFEYLIRQRANKAPIRSNSCWITIWVEEGMPYIPLPHTKQFSLKMSQTPSNTAYNAPDWRTCECNGQSSTTFDKLVQDPGTVLQQGQTCQLVPGSQSYRYTAGSPCSAKNRKHLGQIMTQSLYSALKHDSAEPQPNRRQLPPQRKKQTASKHLKKNKKKQHARYLLKEEEYKHQVKKEVGDIPRFATGANCTMLQRPLPTLPTPGHIRTIKQEPDMDY